jgi:peptidoglycan/LPS O-acetylase OafA/YrhL
VGQAGHAAAWGSFFAGLASVATLPAAIYATRFSESYDLLHAGFVIPVAAALGLVSLALARRASLRGALTLDSRRPVPLRIGRALAVVGLCLAAAAVVALGVYGLLEYVGSRE